MMLFYPRFLILVISLFPLLLQAHFSSVSELENFFRIEDQALINYRQERYPKINFADPLHENLAYLLKDPEQALIIHQAYSLSICPHLPKDLEPAFSRALAKVCFLFGAEDFSPENPLLVALREEGGAAIEWSQRHPEQLSQFVEEANRPARPNPIKNNKPTYDIVILTTSASGGNFSVAKAMERSLLQYPGVRPIVIDVESLGEKYDPVMIASGETTYDGIYRLFQQENKGMGPLFERIDLTKRIEKYIPSCLGLQLKELMRELNPDLILSTRSYVPDDMILCTLGIPFRMIHCDYELSFFLIDLYGKVEPQMMKFWIPCFDPLFFRPYFAKENRLDLYGDRDSPDIIMQKISTLSGQPLETVQGQFELLGYPIHPSFHRIHAAGKLEKLRNKWHIEPGETPVLISMGKNGVGLLEAIFDELAAAASSKMKFIFVCGHNNSLKEKLQQKALNKTQFSIQGLLSAEEMNELMSICPMQITKAGGALTAETLATGIYTLMMGSHLWEEANRLQLLEMGLGQQHNPGIPLCAQIEECLEKAGCIERSCAQQNDWQNLLKAHIDLAKS